MHLAFVDFIYHYDAARPESGEPLGGTTSAICFLARELVKTGVVCTFFNRVTQSCQAYGITSLPLQNLGDEITKDTYTAYIFCGRWSKELVELVRANTPKPLVAWMHESIFVSPFTPALDAFDAVVYVSEWQQRVNRKDARPKWRQAVIRNAMNPVVARSFPAGVEILPGKTKPPILLFAGSFARGAFHIAPLLEKIRPYVQDFSVEIYSNLDPSREAGKDAAYIGWLRRLPNITHIGMVGQNALAQRMRAASILLAPNPWPETSCIALIEGLASGMAAVTTARAALPETASGFARQIPIDAPDDQSRFDMQVDYDAFAQQVLEALRQIAENPHEAETRLRRQVDYFHAHYQWAQRVAPWVEFLKSLA